ncbi:hypothetical protein BT63DRAFT_450206 [Microthyrium microscopicum]|uniref:Uncharacterized protein n=1 Tax=Microthyrium microscopicum TaxID=703497 RepID=A0A6A6UTS6_9PEZI|nr:hypothetical protein BT63DRAFT_450206 [Microthyrium microscopicum]
MSNHTFYARPSVTWSWPPPILPPISTPKYPKPPAPLMTEKRAAPYIDMQPTLHVANPELDNAEKEKCLIAPRAANRLTEFQYGRIYAYLELGFDHPEIAQRVKVGKETVAGMARNLRRHSSVHPPSKGRRGPKFKMTTEDEDALWEHMLENGWMQLSAMARWLLEERGVKINLSTMSRLLQRRKWDDRQLELQRSGNASTPTGVKKWKSRIRFPEAVIVKRRKKQPAADKPAVDKSAVDKSAVDKSASINQQSINQQSINQQSINQQSINQQSMNQQSMNQQSMNQQSINQQSMNQQSINNQSRNHQSIIKQSLHQQTPNQQSMNQQTMNQHTLSRDMMSLATAAGWSNY